VQADLGDDRLGSVAADAGDLIEAVDGGQCRRAFAVPGGRAGGAVGVDALDGRDRGDQLLDPGVSLPVWAVSASIWSSSIRASSPSWSSNFPFSACTSRPCLAFILPRPSPLPAREGQAGAAAMAWTASRPGADRLRIDACPSGFCPPDIQGSVHPALHTTFVASPG
jgi:hypothetical protein